MSDRQTTDDFGVDLPDLPRDEGGPVFREPWEAQAFSMARVLQSAGFFTAAEWAEALAAEISKAQEAGDPDRGDTYYMHWLAALEALVCEKGLTRRSDLALYQNAWQRAARRVPHGQPISLTGEDFI